MAQALRILLVEDEPAIYRRLVTFLEGKRHEVARLTGKPFIDNYADALAVMDERIPDLAILDIKINGGKNGLQLGEYISTRYWIPIIYFTDRLDPRNALAAGFHDAKGFVAKIGKPIDFTQLALDIERVKPAAASSAKRKTAGEFFSVAKIDAATGYKDEYLTRKEIEWNRLVYVTTEGAAKNNVIFHLADGTQWMLHTSLGSVQKKLPPFLVQFNQYQLVNIRHIDRSSASGYKHYISNREFIITDTYRGTAIPVIRLFFPSL